MGIIAIWWSIGQFLKNCSQQFLVLWTMVQQTIAIILCTPSAVSCHNSITLQTICLKFCMYIHVPRCFPFECTIIIFSVQITGLPLVREKSGKFKIMEKSGNFVLGQENLRFWENSGKYRKIPWKSGKFDFLMSYA